MPRALVTGATGLVGSHIVELLLNDGWSVRGLARSDASRDALRSAGAEAVSGDLLDQASLGAASSGVDVTVGDGRATAASTSTERTR